MALSPARPDVQLVPFRQGARSAFAVEIARRTVELLTSSQLLVLSYVASVLLDQKLIIYCAVILNLVAVDWVLSLRRVLTYVTLTGATVAFFLTADKINATATFFLCALGLFDRGAPGISRRTESKLLTYGTMLVIVVAYLATNSFDFNEGVVSHNFIPIVGLYLLLCAKDWSRSELMLLSATIALVAIGAGSRSGAAVFLLLTVWIWSPRAVVALLLAVGVAYLLGARLDELPGQFRRNYETSADPRLFIWAEFLSSALQGGLFRQESFEFMGTFGLDRNFHNSLFEAYYRVGPFVLLLVGLHLRLIWLNRRNVVTVGILAALLLKSLFDTYLWFTPIDLLVFRLYGAQLFGSGMAKDR